ncbi:hypothetical protein ASE75_05070 [Sphingomonas sp. Leaf17]|uniref:hypothetical protein n=1 Tax=Sphingomonas sp. Leaf17 TaxID=1735683 RepID=UPI0007007E32|nr:hypothetical protein [Sphingomonas sp. Leaf17]KQM65623.1 hypothetical protein ASE75_05070 [Sphingomonas sp. Leaf17]
MDTATLTTAERAIELASSGACRSVNEIRQTLRREGRDDVHTTLNTPAINMAIVAAIRASATHGVLSG